MFQLQPLKTSMTLALPQRAALCCQLESARSRQLPSRVLRNTCRVHHVAGGLQLGHHEGVVYPTHESKLKQPQGDTPPLELFRRSTHHARALQMFD